MTPEGIPTEDPAIESTETAPGATAEGTAWPRSLRDLPADSPVRPAYIDYCNSMRHAAPQGSADRPAFRQAIRATKQACLELLRIAEGGTEPSASAEYSQPTVRWMMSRDVPEVLDIEAEAFDQPPQEPLDDSGLLRLLRQSNTIGYIAEIPPHSPTEEDWAEAEKNCVAAQARAQKLADAFAENMSAASAHRRTWRQCVTAFLTHSLRSWRQRSGEQREAAATECAEETETERQERLRPHLPKHVCGHTMYKLHPHDMNVLTMAVHPAERGGPYGQALVARLLRKLSPDQRYAMTQEVEAAHLPPPSHPKNLRGILEAIDQCRDFYLSPKEQAQLRQTLESFPDTPLRTQLLELCAPLLADGAERRHLPSQMALQSVRCLLALASDAGDPLWIDDPETRTKMNIATVPPSDRDTVQRFYEVITGHDERGSYSKSEIWIAATDPERDSVAGLAIYSRGQTANHPLIVNGIWVAPNTMGRGITLLLAEELLKHREACLAHGIEY